MKELEKPVEELSFHEKLKFSTDVALWKEGARFLGPEPKIFRTNTEDLKEG